MSQQIQITGGAKVRDLQDVIIGTSGVLSSLAFNVANGVPKLDSGGKILVSQLPNSVMEYKGTWNAATNTPTLTNGGAFNQGDVYLCETAGTVNFGSGSPISFIVGDQAIYSGSVWQKAGGATGTVTSVAVTETGDSLNITGSPITTSGTINIGFNGTNLQYVNGAGNLTTFPTLITSIGLSMPSAFSVANSPLTANGTIAVTGAGVASQYIRGDGTLADFPSSGGGGSSVSYYLNGGTSQGTIGGTTYYEMSKTAVVGTGVDFAKSGDGFIVAFLTDANDPAQLNIPAGNWNYEIYASMSANGGTPQMYAELYKYDGTTFTLISTSSNEIIYDGTALNLYTFAMAVPDTSLTLTDRLAVKLYATNSGGKTTTIHTQDGHLCQIITTFSTGITALNGLTAQVQYFQTGTSGTDFNISSTTATHTFNIPDASATARGLITTGTQTIAGTKTFSDATKNNGGIFLQNASSSSLAGYMNLGGLTNGVKFTSGGGISNTFTLPSATGYTFTFPNATGTIALTTDLGAYLPLTGGTLTGSLTLPSNTASGNPALYFNYGANAASRSWRLCNDVESYGDFKIQQSTTQTGSTYADILKFTPTGGALFVSSVQATLFSSIGASSGYQIYRRDTSAYAGIWYSAAGSVTLDLAGAAGTVLNFASTGVATLSNLSGTGTRMVVADSSGVLSTQAIPSAGVSGTGTTNYLPKFTGASTIGNSSISDNGTGRVSIGTTSFNDSFVISNSGAAGWEFANTGSVITYNRSTSAYIPMTFQASSFGFTGAATFSSSVGVNGAPTSGLLHILNQSSYNNGAYVSSTGVNGASITLSSTDTGGLPFTIISTATSNGPGAGTLSIYDGTAYRFTLKSGNVGIGTSSPTNKLTIIGAETGTQITTIPIGKFVNTGNSFSKLVLGSDNANYDAVVSMDNNATLANCKLRFYIGNGTGSTAGHSNDQLVLTGGGNVLIGTTTDAGYKLDVSGTGRFSGAVGIGTSSAIGSYILAIEYGGSAAAVMTIKNSSVSGYSGTHLLNSSGTLVGHFGYANASTGAPLTDKIYFGSIAAKDVVFTTNDTVKMTISSSGAITCTSSVTATGFFESSSIKGKDIIATNPLLALDIDVIKYTRKSDESKDIRYGYSAEQIHSLMPELTDKDVTAVKYLDVHTILISQLQKEIKELKAKMN